MTGSKDVTHILMTELKKNQFDYLRGLIDNLENYSDEDIMGMNIKPAHKKMFTMYRHLILSHFKGKSDGINYDADYESGILSRITFSDIPNQTGDVYRTSYLQVVNSIEIPENRLVWFNQRLGWFYKHIQLNTAPKNIILVDKNISQTEYYNQAQIPNDMEKELELESKYSKEGIMSRVRFY